VLLLPRLDMATLASRLPGVDAVLADGAAVPPFDYVVHLMSLPARFGTTLDTVPSAVPYLTPDPAPIDRGVLLSPDQREMGRR